MRRSKLYQAQAKGLDSSARTTIKEALAQLKAMPAVKFDQTVEAAFRLGDYLCSQVMSLWTRYGEENVDWFPAAEDASGVYEDSFGYKAFFTVVTSWGVLQNKWWGVDTPCIILDKWSAGQAKNEADIYNHTFPIGRSMKKTVEYANPHPITGLVFTEEEQEVITEYQSTINAYVLQAFSE